MTALDADVKVLGNLYFTGRCRAAAIAGNRHKIDGARHINGANQICHKYKRTAQHADDQRILVRVILRNLCAQLFYLCCNRFLRKKNLFDVLFHTRYLLFVLLLFIFYKRQKIRSDRRTGHLFRFPPPRQCCRRCTKPADCLVHPAQCRVPHTGA